MKDPQAWVGRLLDELCVDCGFCLPPDARGRLEQAPPPSIDAFTDAVFVAEGLDPAQLLKNDWRAVRARVARHFRASIPAAIYADIGTLLDELSTLGVTITQARYDAPHFGNYYVDLDAAAATFRVVRDRGQYLLEAPVEQLKALGLFLALDSPEELREAVLKYVKAISA